MPQLKALKVSARDAQTILGHTRIGTTLKIYTDTDEAARCGALARLQFSILKPDPSPAHS